MNIIHASSEVVPFAKTGGLADVCGALPVELARLGHAVSVFLPAYRQALAAGEPIEPTGVRLEVPIGSKVVAGTLLRSRLPDSDVPVYLVEQRDYFDRPELYQSGGEDYKDNCERYVFFCRAVMESIRLLDLPVDILHCHDWQTGLIPAYLKVEYRPVRGFENAAAVLTIHNMAYQGRFWHWDMLLTGLDWKYFNWHQMEFYGNLNLLKTGIVFSDAITTVSERYAREIQESAVEVAPNKREPRGCGLEGVLRHRRDVLAGILNGVDYSAWNPAIDPHLPANYTVNDWRKGKKACKAAVQQEMRLPVAAEAPLVGIVGRLVDQKGFDLAAPVIQQWADSYDAQWAILGTGDAKYHEHLQRLAKAHPAKVAVQFKFSDPLAHRIEAGADMFLMPSFFEPCGLNQLYSLKYGTVPVVRATGGLADTITDATPENLAAGTANGFSFEAYNPGALQSALARANEMYKKEPATWARLVETGMRQDWSWKASARKYVGLYQATLARTRQGVGAQG